MKISPNSIVSPAARIRYPDFFEIGAYSIFDDFTYCSTKAKIGVCSHIAPNCTIAGGKNSQFICGDFGGLASGVRVFCASDDFTNDLANIIPPELAYIKNHVITGDVVLENYVTIGSNSVVMPNVIIPEGTVIGAMSFVPAGMKLKPWSVYFGYPRIKYAKARNKNNVMQQVETLRRSLNI